MGSFADYAENKVLDHIFGNTAFSAPANLYIGLSTTTITDAGGNITEPVGNNYSRVAVTNNTTNFPNASSGSKSNGTAITFAQASGSWGTIVDVFVADASSSGNVIAYGTLTASKSVANLDTISFAIGDLTFTLN
jgi:hypothetical protein